MASDRHTFCHILQRKIQIDVVGANKSVDIPVFNVGTLEEYLAVIETVVYRDVFNRKRTGGWGMDAILKPKQGTLEYTQKLFIPRRGEFTDGRP
jgi:hypothetical protein